MKEAASILILFFSITLCYSQTMSNKNLIKIAHTDHDFSINALDDKSWRTAREITIEKYWSGKTASIGRQFKAQLLWSDTALYVRFEANRIERLVISDKPDLSKKTLGLWDRDVCEIFVAPDKNEARKYFEFEVAPTGEWIDVAIDLASGERRSDWEYRSGMQSAVKVEKDSIVMAIKIEWKAFGKTPKDGDVWLGNIFRCVGKDPDRGYLAWSPTMTTNPDFHVPEKFGRFVFQK